LEGSIESRGMMKTHLINGDSSVSKCGVKFPKNITFLLNECDCEKCREVHFQEVGIKDPQKQMLDTERAHVI
jgi:hypothetical protein